MTPYTEPTPTCQTNGSVELHEMRVRRMADVRYPGSGNHCRPASRGERVIGEFRVPTPRLGPASEQRAGRRRTRVPDPGGPVDAPRGDAPAVGAERHAAHAGRMPAEGEDFLSGYGVPQLDGPIEAARNQAPAVR